MNYEIVDCIDAGTEYCPCHLAESNECILCSQLSGKKFCDCINWKGVCIYQEYCWNGGKAKKGRREYLCRILRKNFIDNKLIEFEILIPHFLMNKLNMPGSFIFIRHPDTNNFYDTPISIMEANMDENTINIVIDIRGVKTKKINELKEGENVLIKAPFWNGVQGLKNLNSSKDGVSVVILRGIGQAPAVPVMKKLYSNSNNIITIIDKGGLKDIFISKYIRKYNCTNYTCNILKDGELTNDFKELLISILEHNNVNLIHISAQDIIIYQVLNYVKKPIKFSCSNNAKMCCGEGVCGCCTVRFKGHKVKRMCKVQTDPRNLFEGRRLI